jgi:hypothetical protein
LNKALVTAAAYLVVMLPLLLASLLVAWVGSYGA